MKTILKTTTALAMAIAIPAAAQAEDAWYPYEAEEVTPAFSADGTVNAVTYTPLESAEKPWNICVSFPHMKDAYWLGVNYGVADEAKRLGVAMNNVEISRLIATVQLLDAMPLAVTYTLADQEAQLDSIERSLSGALSDSAWLRPELQNERTRLTTKIQLLQEMDQFLNHSGYDIRQMTYYDGPNGRGELWKAMESLDALNQATMENVGELSQVSAIQAGRDNMHHQGESTAAFVAPYEPTYSWRRSEFDDFYNPVVRGRLPDEADDELTRRGPYDTIFGWHAPEYERDPNSGIGNGGGRTPPTRIETTSPGGFASGGSPRFDNGSRGGGPPPVLVGYTPYGPWTWLSLQLRNSLEDSIEGAALDDISFNDTSLFIRAFGMAMVKMRYLWPQASYRDLQRMVGDPSGIEHGISNQFLDPEWVTRYADAEAIVDARTPRVAYARWLQLDFEHTKINGRWETPEPELTSRLIRDPRPRPGVRRWSVDPPAVDQLDRVGRYIWRDQPPRPREWTDQFGNEYETYYYRYFVWLGLNVGPSIEIENPNPTFRSDDLPAPTDFIHDTAGMAPTMGAIGQPGDPAAFALLGVAKQRSTAQMWSELFRPEAYDGHVAIAQAGIFNNHSWDLWTQMWHAQLEPVQDFAGWVSVMEANRNQASGFPDLSESEVEGVVDYLRSVEGLAPVLLNH